MINVRFRDVDTFHVVHHQVVLSYIEEARTEYMMELLNVDSPDDLNYIMASVECEYRSPIHFGDTIRVHVRIRNVGETSCELEYEVRSEDQEQIVAEARTTQVFYDYEHRQKMSVPQQIRGI